MQLQHRTMSNRILTIIGIMMRVLRTTARTMLSGTRSSGRRSFTKMNGPKSR